MGAKGWGGALLCGVFTDGVETVLLEHDCTLARGKLGGDGVLKLTLVAKIVPATTGCNMASNNDGGRASGFALMTSE